MSRNGNVKAQKNRYKKMIKQVPRAPDEYELIDGNYSHYPYGYCTRYGAYLTMGLSNTHRCEQRQCNRFERVVINVHRNS